MNTPQQGFVTDGKAGFILGQLSNKTLYIAKLDEVQTPELTAENQQLVKELLQNRLQNMTSGQFISATLAEQQISYNIPQLRYVFGEAFDATMVPRP